MLGEVRVIFVLVWILFAAHEQHVLQVMAETLRRAKRVPGTVTTLSHHETSVVKAAHYLHLVRILEAANSNCHRCRCLLDWGTWRITAFFLALHVLPYCPSQSMWRMKSKGCACKAVDQYLVALVFATTVLRHVSFRL